MIPMKGNSAFDYYTTPTISFKSKMIDDQINIDTSCKPDQGWYHLFSWTDRIYQFNTLIQTDIRREDVINEERDMGRLSGRYNVGAEHVNT